ncbi:flippase-like domain-containing protein [Candidatus Woesearchaeota archaeon]|nr:flippase-like domain-containing protein [Candidatus Woesearchaeota archaeon]
MKNTSIFIYVYYKVGIIKVLQIIGSINILLLLAYITLKYLSFIFGGLNIYLLIRPIKKKLRFFEVWRYFVLSWSFGLLFPGKIGEFSLIYFLRKEKIPYSKGLAISIIDKALTLIVLFIFGILGMAIFLKNMIIPTTIIFILIILTTIYIVYVDKVFENLIKHIIKKKIKYIIEVKKEIKNYIKKHSNLIIINLIITAIKWIFTALTISVLFLGFNVKVSIINVISIQSISTIISMIPITVSGIGITESAGIYLYGLVGIPYSVSGSLFIIALFVTYLIGALNFLFLFKRNKKKFI